MSLASALGISLSAAFVVLNLEQNIVNAYFNDTDINNQTHKMMDGANNLTAGCYMNAVITDFGDIYYAKLS